MQIEPEYAGNRLLDLLAKSDSIDSDVAATLAALQQFIGTSELVDDTTIASVEIGDTR